MRNDERAPAPRFRWRRLGVTLTLTLIAGCAHGGAPFPWGAPSKTAPLAHAEVTTVNQPYDRRTAQVLVRRITRPTRANLDFAAYHANFMNVDPGPEGTPAGNGSPPDTSHPFEGAIAAASLTGAFDSLPLSSTERAHPLAIDPLVEFLGSKHVPAADVLEDVVSRVRAEHWGQGGGPQFASQTATLAYIHDAGADKPAQIWIQIEFAPWFRAFADVPDSDGDGFGELYGRVPDQAFGAKLADLLSFIHTEYEGHEFTPAEVKGWAHQLASYWYPSYNTDLVTPGESWPDADTEPAVKAELHGQTFASPTVVMRGKPLGKPVYNVFLVGAEDGTTVDGAGKNGAAEGNEAKPASSAAKLILKRTKPSPNPAPTVAAINAELQAHGGAWGHWAGEVAPMTELMRRRMKAIPAGAKATPGSDGFLFFGQSLAYATGGDLGKQKRGKNPIPVIQQFQKLLADHGVDLLFVPVPTKPEVFPDKLGVSEADQKIGAHFVGEVVNPFERKFILDLGDKGIEVFDLLPGFLRTRKPDSAPIFQAQDTHWTNHGLELAAHALAERVKKYPWYKELAAHRVAYKTKAAPFSRHGDLHSRLPEADKARYKPEDLTGDQVLTSSGEPYDDDPDSPIVVLGDSFTGVYELMDCEHAGVSAHLAKELGYPIDLVMSYGGGPNVRQKLLRRGAKALDTKKLVIWMMTARDLHDFWEGWQPATAK